MRALYDQIIAGGWPAVAALVGQPEGPHLECKVKTDPSTPKLPDDDRARIAKAVCGLANGDGGVFLFGVRAAPDRSQGGLDRVTQIVSITDVEQCARVVEATIGGWIEPPISIVNVEKIEDLATPGSGVVIVYAGSSDGGPHRIATGVNEGRYYLRAGSSTEIMPHTILADRFGRRPQPKLRLLADFTSGSGPPMHHEWGISLRLLNEGRGTARHPAVVVRDYLAGLDWRSASKVGPNWKVLYGHGNWRPNFCGWEAPSDVFIYPGAEVYVAHVGHGTASGGLTSLPFKGTIYAADAQPRDFDTVLMIDAGEVAL